MLLGRATAPGEMGPPTKVEAPTCGCQELPPAIGCFCLSRAEHSQTHLKHRFGGCLNTKPLSGTEYSERTP